MKNYFQVLGLEEGATLDEIKAAYRTYAKNFHPDKQNGNEFFKERFQEIQEAYEYLCQNYGANSEVEKYEESNSPNDSEVYEEEDVVEKEHLNSLKNGGIITLAILLFVILAIIIISYSSYSFNINLWKI